MKSLQIDESQDALAQRGYTVNQHPNDDDKENDLEKKFHSLKEGLQDYKPGNKRNCNNYVVIGHH
jgi:hypothetical protein